MSHKVSHSPVSQFNRESEVLPLHAGGWNEGGDCTIRVYVGGLGCRSCGTFMRPKLFMCKKERGP